MLVHVDPHIIEGPSTDSAILGNQRTVARGIGARLSRDPATEPPDDCNTKEGVLNPVILLRRHQKEGRRAGPRGRTELSASVIVQQSQAILVPPIIHSGNDIFLFRFNGPDAIGKGDLFSWDPATAEVGRGGGDIPVKGMGQTAEGPQSRRTPSS